jgi:hypothetical protein
LSPNSHRVIGLRALSILRRLMDRGAMVPASILHRRPGARRFRFTHCLRYAQRLAKGGNRKLGELV